MHRGGEAGRRAMNETTPQPGFEGLAGFLSKPFGPDRFLWLVEAAIAEADPQPENLTGSRVGTPKR